MSRLCLLVLLACTNNLVATQEESSVAEAFKKNKIVPDVLSLPPTGYLTVQFPSGVKAELGNELTPTQVKDIPTVTWDSCPDQWYTVAMTDPDIPSRKVPLFRELLHWLVGNVRGVDVTSGETVATYISAAPPLGSGLHRYVLLAYKQPSRLKFNEPTLFNPSIIKRSKFSIDKFAKKYNLSDPIAGNFYQAKYDNYVPIALKQLAIRQVSNIVPKPN